MRLALVAPCWAASSIPRGATPLAPLRLCSLPCAIAEASQQVSNYLGALPSLAPRLAELRHLDFEEELGDIAGLLEVCAVGFSALMCFISLVHLVTKAPPPSSATLNIGDGIKSAQLTFPINEPKCCLDTEKATSLEPPDRRKA